MSANWYRNTTWDESIERTFNRKLGRVRLKEQYLRIQASTLAKTHPEATLKLLEQYFELPNKFEHAQAYCDRATALIALGRFDEAVEAYEKALAREAEYPRLQTQAHLELPFHIAVRKLSEHYTRARELLEEFKPRLLFPIDHFKWHAAHALITADLEGSEQAREHCEAALEAASRRHSGFDSHPSAGLVRNRHDDVIEVLEAHLAG